MTDFIYTLTDPRDGAIRYVGKTDNPERRLAMHLKERYHSHKNHWLQELASEGLKPIMTIIETVSEGQGWEDRERYWIAHFRAIGCPLTNGTDGGDHPPDCTGKHLVKSESGRRNIVAALVKRNKSPEMREASRRSGKRNKGRKMPPETIEKLRQRMTGRKIVWSEPARQALIERNKTRAYDPDKMRNGARRLWDDPVTGQQQRERLAQQNRAFWADPVKGPERRARQAERNDAETMRQRARQLWDDPVKGPEARAKLAERDKARPCDSERMRAMSRAYWDDPVLGPERRARQAERARRKHQPPPDKS